MTTFEGTFNINNKLLIINNQYISNNIIITIYFEKCHFFHTKLGQDVGPIFPHNQVPPHVVSSSSEFTLVT